MRVINHPILGDDTATAYAAFNEVYAAHFTGKPARSCVAVLALPKGALVEIEAIAAMP